RDHQDHQTPGEIHTESERLRDTFDSCFQPIDHGIEHIAVHLRRQTIFLTNSVEGSWLRGFRTPTRLPGPTTDVYGSDRSRSRVSATASHRGADTARPLRAPL